MHVTRNGFKSNGNFVKNKYNNDLKLHIYETHSGRVGVVIDSKLFSLYEK